MRPTTNGAVAPATRIGHDLPWGAIRLAVVVLGGLLVLQSSDELDALKLAYLAVAAAALGGSLHSLVRGPAQEIGRRYAYLLIIDAVLFGLIGLSFIVAVLRGTPSTDWLRDAAGYGLFAAVPILALDAAASSSRRLLTAFLAVAGLLAGLSWAIFWIERRQIADLPFDRLALPTPYLATALYVVALAAALTQKDMRRYAWACMAGLVLGLHLVTGNRASLVLLVVPLAMAVVVRPRSISRTTGVVGLHVAIALIVLGAAELALHTPAPDAPAGASSSAPTVEAAPDVPTAAERLQSIESLATDPLEDASVIERVAQWAAAWELFLDSPLIGVGPGHSIEWTDISGLPRDDFTADTPLVLPAKFGLVGTIVVALLVAAYVRTGELVKLDGWAAIDVAVFGYGVAAVVGLPFGMPLEDKGFSFGLALLLALVLAGRWRHRRHESVREAELPAHSAS